ncbi:MAG TPA: hypothetical protein VIU61_11950 [Kofleriaceae bacterium]
MLRAGAVSLMLAGCFAPQPAAGIPCAEPSAAARCPEGLDCVLRNGVETCEPDGTLPDPIDALPDVPPDGDVDKDGVINADDNCVQDANADQSDEDMDAVGDVCDPCPISSDTSDTDGDGVPNDCDPSVQNQDQIALFVSFASGIPAEWSAENATASNGSVKLTAPSGGGAYLGLPAPDASFVAIWSAATFDAFTSTALAGMGLMDRRVPGMDNAVACQLTATSAGTTQKLRLYDANAGTTIAEGDHELKVGTDTILRLTRETSGQHRCSASSPVVSIAGTSAFDPPGQQIGLRMRSGTARYHWIMMLTRP